MTWKKPKVTQDLYRYENKRGHGPYTDPSPEGRGDNEKYNEIHPKGFDEDRHPDPPADLPFSHKSAFSSPTQAHAWFNPSERAFIEKRGQKLVKYDAPIEHVIEGDKQVAFNKRLSRKSRD